MAPIQQTIKDSLRSNLKGFEDKNKDPFKEILAKLNGLSAEIASVKKEMKLEISKLRPLVEEIVSEQLVTRDEKLSAENEALKKRLDYLESREESRSKADKKMNIVIHNLNTCDPANNQVIENFLGEKLQVDIDISDVFQSKTKKNRPLVIAKLKHLEDKKRVMENRDKLQGSGIYITHDRTKKERDIQKSLRDLADGEIKKGNQVVIGYRKLIINGTTKVWREGKGLVEQSNRSSQDSRRHSQSQASPHSFRLPDKS